LALHLEVFVAFGAAEAEDFGVVADEGDALGRVDRARAEVAGFDPGMCQFVLKSKSRQCEAHLMVAASAKKQKPVGSREDYLKINLPTPDRVCCGENKWYDCVLVSPTAIHLFLKIFVKPAKNRAPRLRRPDWLVWARL
jgi:hypothetical protein